MRGPLLLSIAVHAAALIGARPIAARLAQIAPPPEPEAAALEPDRLTGTSIEVSTSLDDGPGASQPPPASTPAASAAAPSAPASPDPASPAPADTAPASPTASSTASPSASPAAPSAPPPPVASSAAPSANASSAPAPSTAPSAADKPRPPRPPRKKRPRPPAAPSAGASTSTSAAPLAGSSSPAPSSSPAASSSPASSADPASPVASTTASASPASTGTGAGSDGTFGPDGDAQKRDLGRAFTRAVPYACAADAVWTKVPVGDAGTLRAAIRVDADGHVTSAEPLGDDPPKHLVSLLQRTSGQLKAGIFAVRNGAVTAGTQTLEIKATVSAEPGDDALAFDYEAGRGKASFIVKDGRRVDVHVRVVKVEVGN